LINVDDVDLSSRGSEVSVKDNQKTSEAIEEIDEFKKAPYERTIEHFQTVLNSNDSPSGKLLELHKGSDVL
jgi:hypothetical protein